MKSKILILIFIIFMMCGCTAEVNLEITKDKINESTSITAYENIIYSKDILRTSFRNYIPIYDIKKLELLKTVLILIIFLIIKEKKLFSYLLIMKV